MMNKKNLAYYLAIGCYRDRWERRESRKIGGGCGRLSFDKYCDKRGKKMAGERGVIDGEKPIRKPALTISNLLPIIMQ